MYKILGADQKEYGPVNEEQLRQWIAEGRANAQSMARFGDGPWKPLNTFPEFASTFGAASPPPPLSPPPPVSLGTAGAMPPATSGMAIGGLICSIFGLFCCGPLFSTLGLIFSIMALVQINQNPLKYSGKGIAVTGIVLAAIGYVFFVVLLSSGVLKRIFRRFPHYI